MLVRIVLRVDGRGVFLRSKASVLGIAFPGPHAFLRWRGEPRLLFGMGRRERAVFTREMLPCYKSRSPRASGLLRAVAGAIQWRSLSVRGEIGTGDAALTALISGILWMVLSPTFPLLAAHGQAPEIHILPRFQKACFSLRASCMFAMRPGQLILAFIKARSGKHESSH